MLNSTSEVVEASDLASSSLALASLACEADQAEDHEESGAGFRNRGDRALGVKVEEA